MSTGSRQWIEHEFADVAFGDTRLDRRFRILLIDVVGRVVLTLSCAVIFSDIDDVTNAPGGILTETWWNETSTLGNNPYLLSKTLAEKAAWRIADTQQRWTLLVVNSALIIGPGTAARQTSASFDYMRMLAQGLAMKVGFIGLGTMGGNAARNITRAGFETSIYDLRREAVDELVAMGASWIESRQTMFRVAMAPTPAR